MRRFELLSRFTSAAKFKYKFDAKHINKIDLTKFSATPVYEQYHLKSNVSIQLLDALHYTSHLTYNYSPLWLDYYTQEKSIPAMISTLKTHGCVFEKNHRLLPSLIDKKPHLFNLPQGINFESLQIDYNQIKEVLQLKIPIVVGVKIYSCFTSGVYIGNQTLQIYGFNDETQRFLIKNTFGLYWCNYGYLEVGYEWLRDNIITDLWIILDKN